MIIVNINKKIIFWMLVALFSIITLIVAIVLIVQLNGDPKFSKLASLFDYELIQNKTQGFYKFNKSTFFIDTVERTILPKTETFLINVAHDSIKELNNVQELIMDATTIMKNGFIAMNVLLSGLIVLSVSTTSIAFSRVFIVRKKAKNLAN